ncbi:DUF7287 family protein [Halosimplex halobium]|uniref:DUF7287 family protein n=1 Tax=Halosimplex halobium TaxID=3396618 RepID=UPI003F550B34
MNRDTHRVGADDRGQSVFDFSIGVSLFLVVVLGVIVFVPTAFGSFTSGAGGGAGDGLAADRAATYLSESALRDSGASVGLDTECTLLFFTGRMNDPDLTVTPSDCGLEQAASLASNASLDASRRTVNVTVERRKPTDPGRELLCWDTDGGLSGSPLVSVDEPACDPTATDVRLTAGPSAANNQEYATAERYVSLGREGVYLVVRVW